MPHALVHGSLRDPLLVRAYRRSALRRDATLALARLGRAYPGQLAAAIGTDTTRLRRMLWGHIPEFDPELSPVPLGIIRPAFDARGRVVFAITPLGRDVARKLRRVPRRGRLRRRKCR